MLKALPTIASKIIRNRVLYIFQNVQVKINIFNNEPVSISLVHRLESWFEGSRKPVQNAPGGIVSWGSAGFKDDWLLIVAAKTSHVVQT